MKEIILSLLTGFLIGGVFQAVKLPVPAPPVLAGVMGVVGIFAGARAWTWVVEWFANR